MYSQHEHKKVNFKIDISSLLGVTSEENTIYCVNETK